MDTIEPYQSYDFFKGAEIPVIQKLENLRNEFQLNHDSLALKWETFLLSQKTSKQNNSDMSDKPNPKTLEKFKAFLTKDQQQISQRPKNTGKGVLNKTSLKE